MPLGFLCKCYARLNYSDCVGASGASNPLNDDFSDTSIPRPGDAQNDIINGVLPCNFTSGTGQQTASVIFQHCLEIGDWPIDCVIRSHSIFVGESNSETSLNARALTLGAVFFNYENNDGTLFNPRNPRYTISSSADPSINAIFDDATLATKLEMIFTRQAADIVRIQAYGNDVLIFDTASSIVGVGASLPTMSTRSTCVITRDPSPGTPSDQFGIDSYYLERGY